MSVATETREQTRARYPDEEGYVERDGVRVFWERLRRRGDDVSALSDLADLALATLEGTDPLPGAPLPRPDVRPTRQRPLGQAGRRSGLRILGVRRGRSCRPRGRGRGPRDPRGPVRRRRLGADARVHASGDGARGRCHRAVRPVPHSRAPELRPVSVHGAARHRRGLGEVQPSLLAARLSGLPRVLLLAAAPGTAFDEAHRGLRRLGARNGSRDTRAGRRGSAAPVEQRGGSTGHLRRACPARFSSSTATWTRARRVSGRRPSRPSPAAPSSAWRAPVTSRRPVTR